MHEDDDADTLPPPPPTRQRTVGADKDDRPKIRISSSGSSPREGHNITINGLDSKEADLFEGAMHGHYWVTVSDRGRLRAVPTYKELPDPVEDEMLQPFWRAPVMGVETQLELFPLEPLPNFCLPSIIIQSLCGYHYSAGGYRREALKLQSWGFECLRSRRNDAGRFHELWLLQSLDFATSELKRAIDSIKKEKGKEFDAKSQLDAAIRFLCRHSSFGTLDATNQRAAMVID